MLKAYRSAVLTLIVLLLSSSVSLVIAAPYAGTYAMRSPVRTSAQTIFTTYFDITNPANMGFGNSIISVASMAGASSTSHSSESGWMYQSVIGAYYNGSTFLAPQAWTLAGQQFKSVEWVGEHDWSLFVGRTYINLTGGLTYKYYLYETDRDVELDAYVYRSFSETGDADDNYFLIGNRTYGGVDYKHFQCAVESPSTEVNGTDWKIQQTNIAYYYSGGWKYEPGYGVDGETSAISSEGGDDSEAQGVAGDIYRGLDEDISGNDYIRWINNQNTRMTLDTVVWSGSGTMPTPPVSTPFS